MSLSDGDAAALARQAVDLLDPQIEIDIEPEDPVDPYRWGHRSWTIWPLVDGSRFFGARLLAESAPAQALAELLDAMSENVAETAAWWATPFPACPNHRHPADVSAADDLVELTCPQTGAVVGRLRPELP